MPALTLTMGSVSLANGRVAYNQMCAGDAIDLSQLPASQTSDNSTGLVKITAALFQNHFKYCIPVLNQITSFGLQSPTSNGAAKPISFCLDDISLLNSTLQPRGMLAAAELTFCGCDLMLCSCFT